MADVEYYDPKPVEARWQEAWNKSQAFAVSTKADAGEPYYVLEMFPYPSGDLHMGHVRNYSIGDVFARFQRKQGKNVLHPMGWDSLGLPAENQAILEKVAPQVRTPKNIARMKEQMTRLGLGYDWSREIATYQPEYYRWNQWFFVQMYKKGLVYRREAHVNFCSGCNTILANEQVEDDGTCWRGHPNVTQRAVPEWAFRITQYAEELLADLDTLKEWPERIVTQQRNWIGKSTGCKVRFEVEGQKQAIEVFTTRVDTIFGCTYVVLAPEHPLVSSLTTADRKAEVQAFVASQRDLDKVARTAVGGKKEGVFTGAYAKNPFTGEQVPVWLANFVLAEYGTGAVMSVPAHDQRDYEFAKQYDLPVRVVISPADSATPPSDAAFTPDGILAHSKEFSGLSSAEAREKLGALAKSKGFGEPTVTWHLRDWGFSRQRYWGTPIPMVYCDTHGPQPVPENELPVRLPDFDTVELTGQGGAPLAKHPTFAQATCPLCKGPARRETETMDTFVDSAWYFARFLSPHDATQPFDKKAAETWLPVNTYIGGPEHAVMHLLYFRFWTKAMRDLGLLKIDEPVRRLITQGMVNAMAYQCPTHGYQAAAAFRAGAKAECPKCQKPLKQAVEKMGKSKLNGVDPVELIEKYGADTARLYVLFAAPPEKDLEWNSDGVEGLARFVHRIYRVLVAQNERITSAPMPTSMAGLSGGDAELRRAVHRTLAKVTEEVGTRLHFNTAIAAMMELVNSFYEHKLNEGQGNAGVAREGLQNLAHMLSPFAPHLAEEIWHRTGGTGFVAHAAWPKVDAEATVRDQVTVAVQVNGKLRGQIAVAPSISEEEVTKVAMAEENVARFVAGKTLRKRVYVPGRLLNFVVSD